MQLKGELPLVTFNYLGQFHAPEGYWQVVPENSGQSFHPENHDRTIINIVGMVNDGELTFTISARLSPGEADTLAHGLQGALEDITAHCSAKVERGESEFTPGDFSYAHLSMELLDTLQKQYPIEYILPAGSLQQGFVYHVLSSPDDDAYRVQLLLDYHNGLDGEKYEEAWKCAVKKFPIMRTCFNWEEDILQIICKTADFEFTCHDITGEPDRDAAVEAIRIKDRKAAFDLGKPGLLRIHLIKQHDRLYTLLKTEHHCIGDGWSYPPQFDYVHKVYRMLLDNEHPPAETDNAYIEAQKYIASHRDSVQAYWSGQMQKIETVNDISSLLSVTRDPDSIKDIQDSREQGIELAGETYEGSGRRARRPG